MFNKKLVNLVNTTAFRTRKDIVSHEDVLTYVKSNKEIVSTYGETLIDAMETEELILTHFTYKFNRRDNVQFDCMEVIKEGTTTSFEIENGKNALPVNARVCVPFSIKEGDSLTSASTLPRRIKQDIIDCDTEDLKFDVYGYKLPVDAFVLHISDDMEYKMSMELYGYVNHNDRYFTLDYKKASLMVSAIYFDRSYVQVKYLKDDMLCLHGLDNYGQFIVLDPSFLSGDVFTIDITDEMRVELLEGVNMKKRLAPPTETFVLGKKQSSDMIRNSEGVLAFPIGAGIDITMQRNRLLATYASDNVDERGYRIVDNICVFSAPFKETKSLRFKTQGNTKPLEYKTRQYLEEKFNKWVQEAIETGIYDEKTGKTWHVALQTASQGRTGKYFLTTLPVKKVRSEMLCGFEFDKINPILLSKQEARIGLCGTIGVVVDNTPNILVVDDYEVTVPVNAIVLKELNSKKEVVTSKTKEYTTTPCDGQGTITYRYATFVAYKLGLISEVEYKYFNANYKASTDVDGGRLGAIFAKVPSSFQIRNAGDKGLLVVFAHDEIQDENGNFPYADYQIVETESMRKYKLKSYAGVKLEIANYNKPKKDLVQLSYQFVSALKISAEELLELGRKTIEGVAVDTLTNVLSALKFLGLNAKALGANAEVSEDIKINSRLTKILSTNPDMIKDANTSKLLARLLESFLDRVSTGKVLVQGDYYYLATDPRFQFPETRSLALKSGVNYLNGFEGEVAGFRSPLVHKSEAIKFPCGNDHALRHLKDVFVFNPHDCKLPAMGGADTDGDIGLFTKEQVILDNIDDCGYLVIDKGPEGVKHLNNDENITNQFKANAQPADVGGLTNRATAIRDLELGSDRKVVIKGKDSFHSYEKKGKMLTLNMTTDDGKIEKKVQINRHIINIKALQNWEIDKAKTGFANDFSGLYEVKCKPHWLFALSNFKQAKAEKAITGKGSTSMTVFDIDKIENEYDKMRVYHSDAPLGQLFDYIQEFKSSINDSLDFENFVVEFMHHPSVDMELFKTMKTTGYIEALEKNYREELADTMQLMNDDDDTLSVSVSIDDLYKKHRIYLLSFMDRYRPEGMSNNDFLLTLATVCYDVTYNSEAKSKSGSRSYPWSIMFDEMLELIAGMDNAMTIYSIPFMVRGQEVVSVEVTATGMLKLNNTIVGETEIPTVGKHKVKTVDNRKYVYAKRNSVVSYAAPETIKESDKLYQVTIAGCSTFGLDILTVNKMMIEKSFSIQKQGNFYNVIQDGKPLGGVLTKDVSIIAPIINKELISVSKVERDDMYTKFGGLRKSFLATVKVVGKLSDEDTIKEHIEEYGENTMINTSTGEIVDTDCASEDFYICSDAYCVSDENDYSYTSSSNYEEEEVTDERTVIDEEVYSQLNTTLPFWNVKSLQLPNKVVDFKLEIHTATCFRKGTKIATLTAYSGTHKPFVFEGVITEKGLELQGAKVSQEFTDWALRMMTYSVKKANLGL